MNRRRIAMLLAFVAVFAGVAVVLSPRNRRPRANGTGSRPEIETLSDSSTALGDKQLIAPEKDAFSQLTSTTSPVASELNSASRWNRFRGPNGTGVSDDKTIPTQWSDTENLLWKVKLPGAGSSSPIVTERFVFVTCYSGYGVELGNPGSIAQLKRELVCIQRDDGKIAWTRAVDAVQPEDVYQGMGVPEHGYATNSATTDGQTVFAFLGKCGVFAFDLEGNQLWQVSVGTDSGNRGWGTAASLMLYNDLLIVNASEENHAIIALDKATGNQVWKAEAATLELCYGTPAIAHIDATRDDLVIAVPGEVWGLNPRTGKLSWFAETNMTDNLSPSVIVDGKKVYAFGGYRSSGSIAMEAGGRGDVTKSHVLWTGRNSSYVATPVLVSGRLYWIDDRGMYYCVEAATGELVHRARLKGVNSGDRPVYASPVVINGLIYAQTRTSGVYVIEPSAELKVVSQNKFISDESVFNATPATDAGQLFLRSYNHLYCVENGHESSTLP